MVGGGVDHFISHSDFLDLFIHSVGLHGMPQKKRLQDASVRVATQCWASEGAVAQIRKYAIVSVDPEISSDMM